MKKITIVWTITLIIIVAGLTIIGFKLKNENTDNILEKALISEAEKYFSLYPNKYPLLNQTVTVTYEELKDLGYDAKLGIDCTGYVDIENKNGTFEYDAYVSCPGYISEGYSKK